MPGTANADRRGMGCEGIERCDGQVAATPLVSHTGRRYRIERTLGVGSIGVVHLVENLELHRLEAVKILRTVPSTAVAGRFRREGRALARMAHPNVVKVYDSGELSDRRPYLAMEYAAGHDLEVLFSGGERFGTERAVALLRQLAMAIGHAHERGIVHRDLKPGNVILAQVAGQDLLKVTDFGIAKIFAADYDDTTPTREGLCCGTPQYMAPEQFRGVADDPRSDLYALGCVGYELLTGAPPFAFTDLSSLFRAHSRVVPRPPSELVRGGSIPRSVDDLILRCLEKRREDRFQSADELVDLLDSRSRGSSCRPPRRATTVDDKTEITDTSDWAIDADDEPATPDPWDLLSEQARSAISRGGHPPGLPQVAAAFDSLRARFDRCVAEEAQLRRECAEIESAGGDDIEPCLALITELQISTVAIKALLEESLDHAAALLRAEIAAAGGL